MVMDYQTALRIWGEKKLREYRYAGIPKDVELYDVRVEMEFNEGYACCGGYDPDCYCSFAESPSANVVVTGKYEKLHYGKPTELLAEYKMSAEDFDFVSVLNEILVAGGGTITNKED